MPIQDVIISTAVKEMFSYAIKKSLNAIGRDTHSKDLEDAAEQYTKRAYRLHNSIRVLGSNEPIELNRLYIRVNILERIAARESHNRDMLEEELKLNQGRFGHVKDTRDGLSALSTLGNIVVLGKPGSGKTTFLSKILLDSLAGKVSATRVPVFLSLRRVVDDSLGILHATSRELIGLVDDETDYTKALLSEGKLLLLLDGLDEVPEQGFLRIINEIAELSNLYPASKFVVSCRGAAYAGQLNRFTDVEVADFSRHQIESYAAAWFSNDDQKLLRFRSKLLGSRAALELCSTPLLLSMICLAFADTGEIENRRALIYSEAVEALLKRWDDSRAITRETSYRFLSKKRKLELLTSIAMRHFDRGELFFDLSDLARFVEAFIRKFRTAEYSVDGEEILKTIELQHGFFVERAKNVYSFSHLTLQEYFSAQYLANKGHDKLVMLVSQYSTDVRWREVILLIGDLLGIRDADRYLLLFLELLAHKIGSNPSSLKKFREQCDIAKNNESALFDDEIEHEDDVREKFRAARGGRLTHSKSEIERFRFEFAKRRWGSESTATNFIGRGMPFILRGIHRVLNIPVTSHYYRLSTRPAHFMSRLPVIMRDQYTCLASTEIASLQIKLRVFACGDEPNLTMPAIDPPELRADLAGRLNLVKRYSKIIGVTNLEANEWYAFAPPTVVRSIFGDQSDVDKAISVDQLLLFLTNLNNELNAIVENKVAHSQVDDAISWLALPQEYFLKSQRGEKFTQEEIEDALTRLMHLYTITTEQINYLFKPQLGDLRLNLLDENVIHDAFSDEEVVRRILSFDGTILNDIGLSLRSLLGVQQGNETDSCHCSLLSSSRQEEELAIQGELSSRDVESIVTRAISKKLVDTFSKLGVVPEKTLEVEQLIDQISVSVFSTNEPCVYLSELILTLLDSEREFSVSGKEAAFDLVREFLYSGPESPNDGSDPAIARTSLA